jgi:site-specific recombinase XerD
MLEELFDPVATEQLRSCLCGAHVDTLYSWLLELGYARPTIREKVRIVGRLSRWMAAKHRAIADLNEQCMEEFVDTERHDGRSRRGVYSTALQLLAHLRDEGAVPTPEPARDDSPTAILLSHYEGYLRNDRAIAESTIAGYGRFVRAFADERLSGGTKNPASLGPEDVRDFLLTRVHRMVPKRVQYMGTALRSFLRYLFLLGETTTDLALAIPMVRQWQLSGVPRHMPTRDVERLLRACDRASVTGRRDYAVLLLLARLGFRASEVITLELADLRWREGEIIVRGKGLIRDRLPILPDVGKALALYLKKDRPTCSCRRVFLCRKAPHRGFSHPSTVSTIVARALRRAGLAPATRGAHLLRHSLATTMVRRGASLSEIGQVLRHRSPNTTEIYAKLNFGALRAVAMPWPTTGGAR